MAIPSRLTIMDQRSLSERASVPTLNAERQGNRLGRMNRRRFLQNSAALCAVPSLLESSQAAPGPSVPPLELSQPAPATGSLLTPIDLTPACWIWYPMGRCLPSTVVLFRREITLDAIPASATGYVLADSRYKLTVNGKRVQWGPAPSDPRWPEADPVDLSAYLHAGNNVIAATVLFYGDGDGTWVMGKPGFMFKLDIDTPAGQRQQVVSDASWQSCLARSWPPGRSKRWYLRAFQEQFDARLYPYGWDEPGFTADSRWRPAAAYSSAGDKPSICSDSATVMEIEGDPTLCSLRARSVPMLNEPMLAGFTLKESALLSWRCSPQEYFECVPPDAFSGEWTSVAREVAPGAWQVDAHAEKTSVLTFARDEQVVGWPSFSIDAPAGTVVEILVHEAHKPGSTFLLNTHFNSWSRFICREGENRFETFDFESYRWIQFVVRNHNRAVILKDIAVRRRIYPWPVEPQIVCSDEQIAKLMAAAVNTLNNSAQDTVVDGMARERQQYSGDGAHQIHALYHGFHENRLPGRFMNTFSQGASTGGYFFDCWPAFDRVWRVCERNLSMSKWGPLLDHNIGFVFDCYNYYLYTGQLEMLKEAYPRFARMTDYFRTIRDEDGLLKVDGLGIPCVWMDHNAYLAQRHKQCAFNLYAAAAFRHALPPLARAFGDAGAARSVEDFGLELESAAVRRFWDSNRQIFVANLPWRAEEGRTRTCDRSLATAILFDQCPGGANAAAVAMLKGCPPEMGFSYPANAVWRYWALAKAREMQTVLDDFRSRWQMPSIAENNTLAEDWTAHYDSTSQWSHCAVAPLILLYHGILGLRPTSPGYATCVIAPQPGDLKQIAFIAHTVRGPIHFSIGQKDAGREMTLQVPKEIEADLILEARQEISLPPGREPAPPGCRSYRLPRGETVTLSFI